MCKSQGLSSQKGGGQRGVVLLEVLKAIVMYVLKNVQIGETALKRSDSDTGHVFSKPVILVLCCPPVLFLSHTPWRLNRWLVCCISTVHKPKKKIFWSIGVDNWWIKSHCRCSCVMQSWLVSFVSLFLLLCFFLSSYVVVAVGKTSVSLSDGTQLHYKSDTNVVGSGWILSCWRCFCRSSFYTTLYDSLIRWRLFSLRLSNQWSWSGQKQGLNLVR